MIRGELGIKSDDQLISVGRGSTPPKAAAPAAPQCCSVEVQTVFAPALGIADLRRPYRRRGQRQKRPTGTQRRRAALAAARRQSAAANDESLLSAAPRTDTVGRSRGGVREEVAPAVAADMARAAPPKGAAQSAKAVPPKGAAPAVGTFLF